MKYSTRYYWCNKYPEWDEGFQAYQCKKSLEDNPYQKDTRAWICWRVGWFGI